MPQAGIGSAYSFWLHWLFAQGPPYQTDDPVPVDLHHYEFYIFGAADGTPVEMDSVGPAFEFNWGAFPGCSSMHPALGRRGAEQQSCLSSRGTGPVNFGLTDMELGAKIAFIKETKHFPQIGSFTMFEMPTGNFNKGLGVGKSGTSCRSGCRRTKEMALRWRRRIQVVPQTNYRDFPYTGWLVKRELNEQWELGTELFAHGREGFAAAQTERSAMIDVGGYYHFKHNTNEQILFCYGHSSQARPRTTHIWECIGRGARTKTTTKKMTFR